MKKLIFFIPIIIMTLFLCSCAESTESTGEIGLEYKESVPLLYADRFSIERYEGGYSVISTANGESYLIVPEGKSAPQDIPENMRIIAQPVQNIYLAATSAMGLFDALGEGKAVGFTGTNADGWYIEYAKNALENGDMLYAGKYREPDYELLLSNGCTFSVQSTMINHVPEVKEKLEELGITVFTDMSSYESHPLGRSEWIKVYGEMTGKFKEAERLFNEQAALLSEIEGYEPAGKTAVYFYITDSGQAVTRKSGDYISKMISLAGGENVFKDLGKDSSSSSVTMEMEQFYETAKDADYIIYNSTIGGEISSVEEIIAKNPLIADFKAVKNNNVWCTKNNLFQDSLRLGTVISDFRSVFTDSTESSPPEFLYKPESGAVD